MHDVYISHSSKDIKRIQELQSYIEKNNYSCFLATNPNDNPNDKDFYMEKIGREMYYAKTFLVTISKNSLNSVQVKREMRLADKYNKKIIPVILDDTDPEDKKNNNIFSIDYLTAGTRYLYWSKSEDREMLIDTIKQHYKTAKTEEMENNEGDGLTGCLLFFIAIGIIFFVIAKLPL